MSNDSVIANANRGKEQCLYSDNMCTHHSTMHGYGYMPHKLSSAIRQLADRGWYVDQVVYSYSTPIAILLSDGTRAAWIIPAVTYSATTSGKHQNRLYRLGNAPVHTVPRDATAEAIERVVYGLMRFVCEGRNWRTEPGYDFVLA